MNKKQFNRLSSKNNILTIYTFDNKEPYVVHANKLQRTSKLFEFDFHVSLKSALHNKTFYTNVTMFKLSEIKNIKLYPLNEYHLLTCEKASKYIDFNMLMSEYHITTINNLQTGGLSNLVVMNLISFFTNLKQYMLDDVIEITPTEDDTVEISFKYNIQFEIGHETEITKHYDYIKLKNDYMDMITDIFSD